MQNPFAPIVVPDAPSTPPPPDAAIDQTTGEALTVSDGSGVGYWTREKLLVEWQSVAERFKNFKDQESDLRKKVVAVFSAPDKTKGTQNVDIGNGWKLKIVKGLNFSLKSKNEAVSHNDAVVAMLSKLAALGPEFVVSAQALVKWKPELSETEYNRLIDAGDPQVIEILGEVVEFSPGSAQVTIVPPKAPK